MKHDVHNVCQATNLTQKVKPLGDGLTEYHANLF